MRVREIYRRLATRLDATVITGNFQGGRDEVIEGVPYMRVGARRPYAWSRLTYARAANAMVRSQPYDAALFDFSGYTPLFLPKARPVGVVLHHLTSPTADERWGGAAGRSINALERSMLRRASRISATSRSSREAAQEIVPHTPVEMVGAGVPEELFKLQRSPGDFLLYFGRLDVFQKGIDTLLEAMAILAKTRPGLELRIVGRGAQVERIRELIATLGLSAMVRLRGAVSDAERNELLATAAIQLMPSRFEGFGLAAAEAMAAGVPLIASSSGSLPEVVDAPRGGILVPPGDARALAEATAALLDAPARRAALSVSARESARRFSWDSVAEAHLGFIQRLAEMSFETEV